MGTSEYKSLNFDVLECVKGLHTTNEIRQNS